MSTMEFLEAPARQAAVVEETEHRPWPLPERPWISAQTWEDLCFLHWRVDGAAIEPLLPAGLELDRFDGDAWLGVVPLRVTGARLRGLPPLPRLSSYVELNLRTYVTRDGRPGIWFFSLDASSLAVVEAARRLYRLPYRHARVGLERRAGWVHVDSSLPDAVFSARYRGEGDFLRAEPGTLERFLVERYCLYAADDEGRLHRAEIHHLPWSLQPAEAAVDLSTLAPPGLAPPAGEPLAHFAARQDAVVWSLEPADA